MEKSKPFSKVLLSILALLAGIPASSAATSADDLIRHSAAAPFVEILERRYNFSLTIPMAYRSVNEPQVERSPGGCLLETGYTDDQLSNLLVREWIVTYALRAALQCATPAPQNTLTAHAQQVAADLFAILVLRSDGQDKAAQRLVAYRLASAPRSCVSDTAPWLERAIKLPSEEIPRDPSSLFTLLRSIQPDEASLAQTLNRRDVARRELSGIESLCLDLRYTVATDSQARSSAKVMSEDALRAMEWIAADSTSATGTRPEH